MGGTVQLIQMIVLGIQSQSQWISRFFANYLEFSSRHILIVGPAGVGKSSLVNMIVGEDVAPVSNSVVPRHADVKSYPCTLKSADRQFRLYDTQGDFDATLCKRIQEFMEGCGGPDLVVYCIGPRRLTEEQRRGLGIIHSILCQKGVPIILVVTGLENQRGAMEDWWQENSTDVIQRTKVNFAAHACVSTLHRSHRSWASDRKYDDCQMLVRDMLNQFCRASPR
ncbi:hypothetical protein HYDPIDRAFT_108365 [Hydnomerulius pinastri MD-312]|nr:hypothetical protein HYDPIDRAFT_108365 [Hydnomerulius pinastri MD-312]